MRRKVTNAPGHAKTNSDGLSRREPSSSRVLPRWSLNLRILRNSGPVFGRIFD